MSLLETVAQRLWSNLKQKPTHPVNALKPSSKHSRRKNTVGPVKATVSGQIALDQSDSSSEQMSTGSGSSKPALERPNQRKYRCLICSQVFRSNTGLRQHNLAVHITDAVNCDKCPKVFRSVMMRMMLVVILTAIIISYLAIIPHWCFSIVRTYTGCARELRLCFCFNC